MQNSWLHILESQSGKEIVINSSGCCPLCFYTRGSSFFYSDNNRDYYRCTKCFLIHVPPAQFISKKDELAEYNKHQNFQLDPGYRKFLNRLFDPVNSKLSSCNQGLDFGSGPGPTLSVMFEEAGFNMDIYDPFYAPFSDVFKRQYDFITASEVVEHLHYPAEEFDRLWSILKPGGWFGIMTKFALNKEAFSKWHYKDDQTHVCFFSKETMLWLAEKWKAKIQLIGKDVVLFQKPF
jgi:SAM-dependent methyltransferase